MTKNDFMTNAIAEDGMTFAEAEKAWKEEYGGKSKTEVDYLYDEMVTSPMSEAELYEWVKANGTPNTARWTSYHNRTRRAMNKVHANNGVDAENEAASKELRAEIKAMYTK